MSDIKPRGTVHIIGGGTFSDVRPHCSLATEAYGETARKLHGMSMERWGDSATIRLHLTKMADSGRGNLRTNQDVGMLLKDLVADPITKVIILNAALCDFNGSILDGGIQTSSGKSESRLKTRNGSHLMEMRPAEKLVGEIRKYRKDIFLVSFKTTTEPNEDDQFEHGLKLLKTSSSNLVLVNDLHSRKNMIVVPERSRYCVTTDRDLVLRELVDMTFLRSGLTFTRSTVVDGPIVPWSSDLVPSSLRAVVDHCVSRGAYKPFLDRTEGHFAVKLQDGGFLTSIRKRNFNRLDEVGMVKVEPAGEDSVTSYGARPSVGGQSQRIVFADHPDADCIVHFHCPTKPDSNVPIRSQREYECGSHECGRNTSSGLSGMTESRGHKIRAVMLDRHGPNIVFNSSADPNDVIDFIERNFDLTGSTDGRIGSKVESAPAYARIE